MRQKIIPILTLTGSRVLFLFFYFIFVRIFIAGFLLFLFNAASGKNMSINKKDWPKFLCLALCEPFIYFIFETYGLKFTGSPTISAMVIATIPIFSVGAGILFFREKVNTVNIVGILLSLVGISDKADAYPGTLSGGQKQRVAIARALANKPSVLLCDEATSALDPQTTRSILRLLKDLNTTLGITIVLITHEMAVVREICDRVAVMEQGSIAEQGEVFDVFAAPQREITKSFVRTTSNLQKIEELVAEDSPVARLSPGELLIRLSYLRRNVSEPLISTVSQRFGVTLNIIFADISIVQGAPIGGTVAIIGGARGDITKAVEYLTEKNVYVEVLRDAGAAE